MSFHHFFYFPFLSFPFLFLSRFLSSPSSLTSIRRQPSRGGDTLFPGEEPVAAVALNQICVSDSTPGVKQPTPNFPFPIVHRAIILHARFRIQSQLSSEIVCSLIEEIHYVITGSCGIHSSYQYSIGSFPAVDDEVLTSSSDCPLPILIHFYVDLATSIFFLSIFRFLHYVIIGVKEMH